jgi:single-stranded-DNA-specific exonuclease
MTTKHWEIAPRAPTTHFEQFPDIPPLVLQVLFNRNIKSPEQINQFVKLELPEDDPFLLMGMPAATERLAQAIINQEEIVVYGDYDVDGVTATALMMQFFKEIGATARPYIPNRFDEGYGLNNEALQTLADQGAKVILTVDCGIRSVKEVAFGNECALDIIITDHHHVGEEIPPAVAVINSKQPGCPYPFKELAGVGLAFKLVQGLLRTPLLKPHIRQAVSQGKLYPNDYYDLVALGTVADLALLTDENRKLVTQGIQALNQRLRPGLAALMQKAKLKSGSPITAQTIGFTIGPRLNAAGRLDSAMNAYKLLCVKDEKQADQLATELDSQNRERQQLTEFTVDKSRERIVDDQGKSPLYLIESSDFNPGVVGLAASRLMDEFYRPVLVAAQDDEKGITKGSARSIPEFHITRALDQCADLLVRYGGHAVAAGFTVETEKVPDFRARLLEIAGATFNPETLRPTLLIDAEVNLRGVKPELVDELIQLSPFGQGNPMPTLSSRHITVVEARPVGKEEKHLRLSLTDGKQPWNGIAFNQGSWAGKLPRGTQVDIAYNPEYNYWNGQRTVQLNVKDIKLSQQAQE